jgi:hypothetical protein
MANLLQSAQVEQISADSGIPSVSLHQRGLVSALELAAPFVKAGH